MSSAHPPQDPSICLSCGAQNAAGKRFCSKCGKPLIAAQKPAEPVKCPKCNVTNTPGARFCTGCNGLLTDHFTLDNHGEYFLVICNIDHIDYENARDLTLLMRNVKSNRVLFDLAKLQWVDSIGIGAFVTLASSAARKGQEIKFCQLSQRVIEGFKRLHVDNVLDVCAKRADALGGWHLMPDS